MNPEQALKLLDQVLSNVQGTRKDHELILTALDVLRRATAGNTITRETELPEGGRLG